MQAKFSNDGERLEDYECFLPPRMVDFDCDAVCVRKAFNSTSSVMSGIERNLWHCESEIRWLLPILDRCDGADAIFLILTTADVSRKPSYEYIEERHASGGKREQDL